ncbi:hypothetical protein [uncultured Jatrophihabitans sp.]|uniref:hypothetical protein n=1 Tax=uncultured Jatrophihabitans sp. TaxID=1610747 RepID=UPI0035CB9FE4
MPDNPVPDEGERAAKLDAAIAESQRLEREERDADLARQVKIDQALSEALAKRPKD